ncbi:c-type cytochrome biogenesis protein CcmI [Candidatus Halocynthiibacter alkanivorans]|uniref:c-type cytochrome biogenesis protein CcmI n=1 Tax=Candidatus Halocynthiibacter alkanivorans TaxID=2267619 RepID=UPI000DF30D2B|nr:c-type cytochrome biogenesis protein CcmI [Candidatus Halocynthiibacter alkanivorans]
MAFWFILVALGLLALLLVILPLRGAAEPLADRRDGAMAIYSDQLREVEGEARRGVISADEARGATLEIKQRMLALNRSQVGPDYNAAAGGRKTLVLVAVLVPVLAGGIYFSLGSPGTESLAFADRQDEQADAAEVDNLTARLEQRLMDDPQGGPSEGWVLLGRTYMRMGRFEDAANAFATLAGREDVTADILSQYAEALISLENGVVTPRASQVIDRARELDPRNPAGVFYKAVALDQQGKSEAAHALLIARLNAAGALQPWMEIFVDQANRIGMTLGKSMVELASFAPEVSAPASGPSAAEVVAASDMSESDRAAFVRSMVERLATRLETEPGDLDGWLRLANAYGVLGETEKSRNAFLRARDLAADLSAEDPRVSAIAAGIAKAGGE